MLRQTGGPSLQGEAFRGKDEGWRWPANPAEFTPEVPGVEAEQQGKKQANHGHGSVFMGLSHTTQNRRHRTARHTNSEQQQGPNKAHRKAFGRETARDHQVDVVSDFRRDKGRFLPAELSADQRTIRLAGPVQADLYRGDCHSDHAGRCAGKAHQGLRPCNPALAAEGSGAWGGGATPYSR